MLPLTSYVTRRKLFNLSFFINEMGIIIVLPKESHDLLHVISLLFKYCYYHLPGPATMVVCVMID